MAADALTEAQLRRLLAAGRSLVAQLDIEAVLDELLEIARELTGAQYAALGVLDEHRRHLERFVTKGLGDTARRAIGELPHGRGILGVLIDEPRPLRLARVGDDPRSYGFPAGHPAMDSFLGVPVIIRGQAWGNLYLTEKAGGAEFTDADEQAIVVLADWAAIAIDNARLYQGSERRRVALEQAVLGLEATTAIARAIGGETDLERILELVVKRGRALVDARALVIVLREGERLVVAAGAGDVGRDGRREIGTPPSVLDAVMRRQEPENVADLRSRVGAASDELQVADPQAGLFVPLVFQGRTLGALCAFDRRGDDPTFTDEHERLMLAFAASAATAVATARTAAEQRLRASLRSADEERRRWARELHDDTLQAMAALRLLLSSALRRAEPEVLEAAVRDAVEELGTGIDGLRALITDLRPAALDDLGLQPALEALAERVSTTSGVDVSVAIALGRTRLAPDLESAVYRLVQEALTNVVRHSGARAATVVVEEDAGHIVAEIRDDGTGFDPSGDRAGFGLIGMEERMALVGGTLSIESSTGGTHIRATAPVQRRGGASASDAA